METPVRTTLDINDALLARAKAAAARERISLTRLIEEGIALRLRRAPGRVAEPVTLPVYHGKSGLAPGIDALSNRALFDAADAGGDSEEDD